MTRSCHQCKRLNPSEAAFCYYDGVPLSSGQGAGEGGSIDFATWVFPSPFVFPDGQKCVNFLQLAIACCRNRDVTSDALQGGFLEKFFGSLGRMDLAMAARTAGKAPDRDRGLDDLLGKLPGSTLEPAKLEVEPQTIDLGVIPVGQDHTFELTLTNKGDRLVSGKANVDDDCDWIVLGESGTPEKIVQFFDSLTLPVRIRGDRIRAYHKPHKAHIQIESNGGAASVLVMLTVPIKPFPEGVLAGAQSPRQVAEKAKAKPKEAAVLLESGAVRKWYEDNGWPYPVQAPTASGLAAVQQLFEVLGLVKTPKVELTQPDVTLHGKPGERLESSVVVVTREKRAAVAHGVSDQPWLTVGKTVFKGQTATIPLTVEEVPAEPGQTLTAQVKVTANGNQRFDVPVTLIVGNGAAGKAPAKAKASTPIPAKEPAVAPVEVQGGAWGGPFPPPAPPANLLPSISLYPTGQRPHRACRLAPRQPAETFAFTREEEPPPSPAPRQTPKSSPVVSITPKSSPVVSVTEEPAKPSALVTEAAPAPAPPTPAPPRELGKLLVRLLPVGIVLLGLMTAISRDLFFRGDAGVEDQPMPEIDFAHPLLDVRFHDALLPGEIVPFVNMSFGLGIPDASKPEPRPFKTKLIYDEYGRTCNVCVRVDNKDFLWGREQGKWQMPIKQPLGKDQEGHPLIGAKSVWEHTAPRIDIAQIVEIVPGGLSADSTKRLLDTCLVRYDITNRDDKPHKVGLRFLLDTFIGSNDAVPFTIAGAKETCSTMKSFDRATEVPDFISALEKQDLNNPGTVAHLSLKYGAGLEPPTRVTLGAWPVANLRKEAGGQGAQMFNTRWAVPVLPMALAKSSENPGGDSAVTLYWDDKELPPKETRTVGFAYGLGSVTGEKTGGLGITASAGLMAGKEFTLTAYVKNPAPGTTITLTLPKGLELAGGTATESVPAIPPGSASPYSPVTWRVKAIKGGVQRVRVSLSTGATLDHRLVVSQAQEIFK